MSLSVEATSYQIKASSLGDGPVFVDWALFLDAGVGQAAASGTSAASGPSQAIPLPCLASAGWGSSGPASGTSGGLVAATASALTVGGPVGRPAEAALAPVGPTTGRNSSALAFAGHSVLEGLVLDRAIEGDLELAPRGPARPIPTLELLADPETSRRDEAALAAMSWWERLIFGRAAGPTPDVAPPGEPGQAEALAAVAAADLEPPTPEEGRAERASLGLEVLAAAGVVASIVRRARRKKRTVPAWRRFEDSERANLPLSMI